MPRTIYNSGHKNVYGKGKSLWNQAHVTRHLLTRFKEDEKGNDKESIQSNRDTNKEKDQ